jgi:signal peptidase I
MADSTRRYRSDSSDLDPSRSWTKRVIGCPGDTIEIRQGLLILNGRPIEEPFARSAASQKADYPSVHLPAGFYFVLGDDRARSIDGRSWGPIQEHRIYARVWFRFWPLSRLGSLLTG